MSTLLFLLLHTVGAIAIAVGAPPTTPKTLPFGVRLAYSSEANGLIVTWSTLDALRDVPCVELLPSATAAIATTTSRQRQLKLSSSSSSYLLFPYTQRNQRILICGGGDDGDDGSQQQHPTTTTTQKFIEPSTNKTSQYIHSIDIIISSFLTSHSDRVAFRCGNDMDGWSQSRPLPLPFDKNKNNTFLIVGDLGVYNSRTLPALISEIGVEQQQENKEERASPIAALIHVGDLAYDLASYHGHLGQHFLRLLEPITSRTPYMVVPGNHEQAFNFSHYSALYRMPLHPSTQNLYYSFDMGLVHVVVYNTEVFFWPEYYGEEHMDAMTAWLERDLITANQARRQRPWILVVGHRPMYCAQAVERFTSTSKRCGFEAEASRRGIPSTCPRNTPHFCHPLYNTTRKNYPIEELLVKYKANIAVFGHVHDYERYYPVYDYHTASTASGSCRSSRSSSGSSSGSSSSSSSTTTAQKHYIQHFTSGAGGNREMKVGRVDPPRGPCHPSASCWCAFQSGFHPLYIEKGQGHDYSYSRVTVVSGRVLRWQQISVGSGNYTQSTIIDDVYVYNTVV